MTANHGDGGSSRTFEATIVANKAKRVLVPIPFDPDDVWGPKLHHHVSGTVRAMGVRGVIEPLGAGYGLVLGAAWRRDCGVNPGDVVAVVLWPEGPQQADLAPDLAATLASEPDAAAFFDSLAVLPPGLPPLDRCHEAATFGQVGPDRRSGQTLEGRNQGTSEDLVRPGHGGVTTPVRSGPEIALVSVARSMLLFALVAVAAIGCARLICQRHLRGRTELAGTWPAPRAATSAER